MIRYLIDFALRNRIFVLSVSAISVRLGHHLISQSSH